MSVPLSPYPEWLLFLKLKLKLTEQRTLTQINELAKEKTGSELTDREKEHRAAKADMGVT